MISQPKTANIKGHSTAWTPEGTCGETRQQEPALESGGAGRQREERTGRAGPSPEENGHYLWAGKFFWEEAHGKATTSGAQAGRAAQSLLRRDAVFSGCSGKPLKGFQ